MDNNLAGFKIITQYNFLYNPTIHSETRKVWWLVTSSQKKKVLHQRNVILGHSLYDLGQLLEAANEVSYALTSSY